MIRMLRYCVWCAIAVVGSLHELNAQDFQTITYYSGDSVQLALDLFTPDSPSGETGKPLVIFVHGGGFSGGNRTAGHSLCRYLAGKGMVAASVSYTLYMRDKNFSCAGILSEKVKAIQIAVNQLWLATGYFLGQKDTYGIDTSRIFIAGSSAGAETVLHAAFWDREVMNLYEQALPESFRYAGLISGAGAIMDLNLIDKESLIPVMLFHGDADPVVPYATAAHHYCPPNSSGWLMLFGSKSIYEHILPLDGTVCLITHSGGKHEIAGAHFFGDHQPVGAFVEQVISGDTFQMHIMKTVDK